MGLVKVVCLKKWVKEFNNRETLDQKLIELKIGAGFPGAQRVNRFFVKPTDMYSILTMNTEAEIIPFYSMDRVKQAFNRPNF